MTHARLATLTLRLDAAANAGLALVLLAGGRPLADAARLGSTAPLLAVALLLAVNAVLCWQAAASTAPVALRRLAAVDVVFAVAVVAVALSDPTGAAPWLRWALAGLGDVVAVVAAVKLFCAQRLAHPTSARRTLRA
jgi:hypothetical protein